MSCDIQKDTCDACGCSMEIGTIIGEDDCLYAFELKGIEADVKATYAEQEAVAKEADATLKVNYTDSGTADAFVRKGEFVFSCTAEKLIFQMKAHVI